MSDSQAYEYRAFLLQISDKLSQEDSIKIIYLEDLPVDMESKPPLTLLTQLEMRGKVSASRPDDLAKILKKIERHDLAKKVKDFAKQQKKGRTTAQTKLQRLDHATTKLSANFQVTLLQCEILLHQMENLRDEAEKAGYKRVTEVVAEAHAVMAESGFQRKLLYASKLMQEEQGFCREQSGESNPSSDSQPSSLDFEVEFSAPTPVPVSATPVPLAGRVRLPHTVNSSELRAAVGNLKARSASLPRSPRREGPTTKAQPTTSSGTKQPLMPTGAIQRYPQVDKPSAPGHGSLPRVGSPGPLVPGAAAGDTGRHLTQGLEEQPRSGVTVAQLVTGRLKPTPPPKPKIKVNQKIKQAVKDSNTVATKGLHKVGIEDSDYDYLLTSSYTGTGDSGFYDSREFLQVSLSGKYQLPSQGVQYPPHAGQQQGRSSHSTVTGSAEPRYYKSLQRDAIQGDVPTYCDVPLIGTNRVPAGQHSEQEDLQKDGIKGPSLHGHTDIDKKIRHTFKLPSSVSTYYQCSKNVASVPFLNQVEILTCNSSGCEYYNHDHGITLRIPDGAIPPGMTVHLEVAVALYGPFQFSNGLCPISPILWLCIQENIDLRNPVDIILPHFLTDLNKMDVKSFGIHFAKADHKQYTTDDSGQNLYIFKPLETAFIAYKERNQNYGILSTQHCCFFCITSNDPQINPDFALKAGYYLWCIEKPFSHSSPVRSRDTLLFCATFCLPTCRKALKSQYTKKEGYFVEKPKFFRFKNPGDGLEPCLLIKVEDEGCILAANPKNKQITASQVYFWDKESHTLEMLQADKVYPPSVALTLEVIKSHPINLLVKFNGSAADNNMDMEVMLPLASSEKAQPGPSSPVFESQWISTDKPKIGALLKELYTKAASKWEDIGLALEIEPESLESLKTAENNTPQSRLREMLKMWLKKINPPPSWMAITDTLQHLGDEELAHYLRSKYLK